VFLQKGVTIHSNKSVVNNFAHFLDAEAAGRGSKKIPAKWGFDRDRHFGG
jgi:hypothetical protein